MSQEFGLVEICQVHHPESGRLHKQIHEMQKGEVYCSHSQSGVHQHDISDIKGRVFQLKAGLESVALAGRVLGGLGAGIAVGVAAHGWSTTKPMQILNCAKYHWQFEDSGPNKYHILDIFVGFTTS